MKKILSGSLIISLLAFGFCFKNHTSAIQKIDLTKSLTASEITVAFPSSVKIPEKPQAANTGNTTTKLASEGSVKVVRYRILVWGDVVANLNDFKTKVAATLNDQRGWVRAGLKFTEVSSGADVDVILSDPAHLDAINGCSGELSCATFNNQVIINDIRWREGTVASRAANMSQRDYQHMVINHEMGHWLGHYSHIESCPNGGPAPIMLQQSTGMRGCSGFNAWPLESELWTNK